MEFRGAVTLTPPKHARYLLSSPKRGKSATAACNLKKSSPRFECKNAEQSSRFREAIMRAILRGPIAALIFTAITAMSPLAAEPIALRGYNAPVGESSISGVSSGAFMAVQFGTAWSSIIKGVGVVAGGPYWCAKADAYDAITWDWGPILRATGACMQV